MLPGLYLFSFFHVAQQYQQKCKMVLGNMGQLRSRKNLHLPSYIHSICYYIQFVPVKYIYELHETSCGLYSSCSYIFNLCTINFKQFCGHIHNMQYYIHTWSNIAADRQEVIVNRLLYYHVACLFLACSNKVYCVIVVFSFWLCAKQFSISQYVLAWRCLLQYW